MNRLPLALLLLAPLTAPGLAQAQDRPAYMPTRDVTVTYRANAEGQPPAELKMYWLTAQGLMRMDMPGGQGHMVVNSQTGQGFMVMTPMRMVMDMPANQQGMARFARPSDTARFTREGNDRVANTPCVNWRVEDRGETARVCVTADGVTLRAQGGAGNARGAMEATLVEYGAQDAARFARPAGYQTMQVPGGAGGQVPGGPPAALPGRGTALPPPGVAPR